jgi:GxxExxY protein
MTQIYADDGESQERDPQTYSIIGAAMEAHRQLGPGFLEPVYQEALEAELAERGIPFKPQVELAVYYKTKLLKSTYKPDFVCFDTVIVEIKALSELTTRESAQVVNYLKATQYGRGILLNFGTNRLEYKRFILSPHLRSSASSVD